MLDFRSLRLLPTQLLFAVSSCSQRPHLILPSHHPSTLHSIENPFHVHFIIRVIVSPRSLMASSNCTTSPFTDNGAQLAITVKDMSSMVLEEHHPNLCV